MATAPEILKKAAQHMEDRAAARDQAGGERSMVRTVAAFNAITGHQVSERDGWLFMAVLKAARACTTPTGIADDYEDGAAYFGLAGEAAGRLLIDSGKPKPANDNGAWGVVIGGVAFNVPDDFNFVAQDMNGGVWAYTDKPSVGECDAYWWKNGGETSQQLQLGEAGDSANWRHSLFERPA